MHVCMIPTTWQSALQPGTSLERNNSIDSKKTYSWKIFIAMEFKHKICFKSKLCMFIYLNVFKYIYLYYMHKQIYKGNGLQKIVFPE